MVEEKLVTEVLSLPADQRRELAERLWESLHDDPDAFPLTAELKALLDERLLDEQLNPGDESSLEEVLAELRAKP